MQTQLRSLEIQIAALERDSVLKQREIDKALLKARAAHEAGNKSLTQQHASTVAIKRTELDNICNNITRLSTLKMELEEKKNQLIVDAQLAKVNETLNKANRPGSSRAASMTKVLSNTDKQFNHIDKAAEASNNFLDNRMAKPTTIEYAQQVMKDLKLADEVDAFMATTTDTPDSSTTEVSHLEKRIEKLKN